MLKRIAIYFILFMMPPLCLYFIAAFIEWDINPGNWDASSRQVYGIVAGILGCIVVWIQALINEAKQNQP